MKTSKVLLILVTIMIISLIGASVVIYATGSKNDFDKYREVIDQSATEAIDGINRIVVKSSSADITVIPTDAEEVSVSFTGERFSLLNRSKTKLTVEVENSTLTISTSRKGFDIMNWTNGLKLTVYIPKTYQSDLSIKLSSGDVKVNELSLNKFTYDSSSGDLELNNLAFTSAEINASSGDVEGTIREGDLSINLSSGDVDLVHKGTDFNIDIDLSSGDIELSLLTDVAFDLDLVTSSGDIDCDFPVTISKNNDRKLVGYVNESGLNQVTIRSSSGDIEIIKY